MHKIAAIVVCAWMTTACASGARPMQVLRPTSSPLMRADCPPLPQPQSGQAGELLRNHAVVAHLYHQCAARLRALAQQLTPD